MSFVTSDEEISMFPSCCFEVIFTWVFSHMVFFKEKKIVLVLGRECVHKG